MGETLGGEIQKLERMFRYDHTAPHHILYHIVPHFTTGPNKVVVAGHLQTLTAVVPRETL